MVSKVIINREVKYVFTKRRKKNTSNYHHSQFFLAKMRLNVFLRSQHQDRTCKYLTN